jgi:HSP20 family molecular chaperone IbpA
MNLSAVYLAILSFGIRPRFVRAIDLMGLALWEPPRELFDLSYLFYPTETLSGMIRRHQEFIDSLQHPFFRGASWTSTGDAQMVNDENRFEVSLDISGMNSNDLTIQFDESTLLLTISGHHTKMNEAGYHFDSQFSRSFSVDPFVQVEKMTADVHNDRLTVSAPKDINRLKHSVRTIPIIDTNKLDTLPAIDAVNVEDERKQVSKTSRKDFDPFHVKERVEQAQLHLQQSKDEKDITQQNYDPKENPIEKLLEEDKMNAYRASELRRRR